MSRPAASALSAALARVVDGPVLAAHDPDVAESVARELAGFQLAVPHRPDVVIAPSGPDDVAAILRCAAAHDAAVTVHTTGHGVRVGARGGIVLVTRLLGRVVVDRAARTARIGGGAHWGAVVAATAGSGLIPPSGSAASTGVAGYLFGGGIGLLGRSDGWAVDHVRSVTVTTADGHRTVGPDDGADFARLRGTGPRPGEVVTEIEIGLTEEGQLHGGGLAFDLGPAAGAGDAAVLHAWADWTRTLPDEITAAVRVVALPDVDALPPPLRGRRLARVAVALRGTADDTARLLAPLRAAGRPVQDTVGPLDYRDAGRVHAEPEEPGAYTGQNLLLDAVDPAGLDALAGLGGPMVVTGLRHLGAALARPPAVPDTVVGRGASYLITAVGGLDGPDLLDDPVAAAGRIDVGRALRPFAAAAVGVSPAFTVGPQPEQAGT